MMADGVGRRNPHGRRAGHRSPPTATTLGMGMKQSMNSRRLRGSAGPAVAGAVLVAGVLLGSCERSPRESVSRPPARAADRSPQPQAQEVRRRPAGVKDDDEVLLAWSPAGLPEATERLLEHTDGVRDATTVLAGLDWIRSSDSGGSPIDSPAPGYAIPLEIAVIEPREYARFVPPGERAEILGMDAGEVLLADTEADLRGAGQGLRLRLRGRTIRASGVVSDLATNAYEALAPAPAPASWRDPRRFVLMHLKESARRTSIRATIARTLEPGSPLRIRARGETPFLRYGDAVKPQLLVKKTFGEFAARPGTDGRITIEPRWMSRNLRIRRVPLLGRLTCHRALWPQLETALRGLEAEGLSHVIDASDQAGCWVPRFIGWDPDGWLSHHAWGIALDVNVSNNPFGAPPDQDPRFVAHMERSGFTWGGRWLIPDGMHFEWSRWTRERTTDR